MISVVVPVYKVEKYLRRCIDSILNQTFRDFELILVDDGSPDKCPEICDEYQEKSDKVAVIHKKNGGLSDARNEGVNRAKGEYITFIDSDDFVSDHYLETLWKLKSEYKSDMAVTGIQTFFDGEKPYLKNKDYNNFLFHGIEALQNVLYQKYLDTSACAILIPTSIAQVYPFPVGRYHEDEFTTYKFYEAVSLVAVTTKKQYYYLQRKNSIMHHEFGQECLDELDAADNLVEICKQKHPELVSAAIAKKFSDYCQVLLGNKKLRQEHPECYKRIMDFLNCNKKNLFLDQEARMKNRVAAFVLMVGGSGGLRCCNWLSNFFSKRKI